MVATSQRTVPSWYPLVALGRSPSSQTVAEYVQAVECMRRAVHPPSLVVHSLRTASLNEGFDGTEDTRRSVGVRFNVELRGGFRPLELQPGRRFNVWAAFTRCRVRGSQVPQVIFEELYAGVVVDADLLPDAGTDPGWGEVFDITRATLQDSRAFCSEPPRIIPRFPLEWQQLVMAHVTAQTLGWFLDNRGNLPN